MTSNSDLKTRALEIIRRHEAVEEAKEDLKAAYEAAESVGFTKKALRAAIKIHRLDADKRAKHDSAQMDLELYLAAIEGRERQAAE
jgi:uncharacterized protein (UPF0335 family)